MTQADLLTRVRALSVDEQISWMLRLGGALTVSARTCYETGTDEANGRGLRGFNEIQHRVYARIRDLQNGSEWTLEDFLDMLYKTGTHFNIWPDMGWAIRESLKYFERPAP